MHRLLFLLLLLTSHAFALTDAELDSIGRRIWKNECNGTRDGLTSWNTGEAFASLGIGHFIWYPKGENGPFEESFPKLVTFLSANGKAIPMWMRDGCPWSNRAAFQADFRSPRMNDLRDLLASTVHLQSEFLVQRMRGALPKMRTSAPPADRGRISANFARLSASSAGTFALIDYVNFKGEGTRLTERYNGEGWGLMQALAAMDESGPAPAAFARAAVVVLERRVKNSPPQRGEARWLPGWRSRVRAYAS